MEDFGILTIIGKVNYRHAQTVERGRHLELVQASENGQIAHRNSRRSTKLCDERMELGDGMRPLNVGEMGVEIERKAAVLLVSNTIHDLF